MTLFFVPFRKGNVPQLTRCEKVVKIKETSFHLSKCLVSIGKHCTKLRNNFLKLNFSKTNHKANFMSQSMLDFIWSILLRSVFYRYNLFKKHFSIFDRFYSEYIDKIGARKGKCNKNPKNKTLLLLDSQLTATKKKERRSSLLDQAR